MMKEERPIFGQIELEANSMLRPNQKDVYTVIKSHMGNNPTCNPSLAAMRERLKIIKWVNGVPVLMYKYSISQISRIIKSMEADGWVTKKRGGYGRSNILSAQVPERFLFSRYTPIGTGLHVLDPDAKLSLHSKDANHVCTHGMQNIRKEQLKEKEKKIEKVPFEIKQETAIEPIPLDDWDFSYPPPKEQWKTKLKFNGVSWDVIGCELVTV